MKRLSAVLAISAVFGAAVILGNVVNLSVANAKNVAVEYTVKLMRASPEDVQKMLNEFGADGWLLVTKSGDRYIFTRER